jgi:hypothetical protein
MDAEDGVADGVNAAVHRVKPARRQTPRDGALVHAERDELPRGDDPVLAAGKRRDLAIKRGWDVLGTTDVPDSSHCRHGLEHDDRIRACEPAIAPILRKRCVRTANRAGRWSHASLDADEPRDGRRSRPSGAPSAPTDHAAAAAPPERSASYRGSRGAMIRYALSPSPSRSRSSDSTGSSPVSSRTRSSR